MSYESKIESVKTLIQEHNKLFDPEFKSLPGQVNIDDFINCLKFKGWTTDDKLKSLSYEQVSGCFPSHFGNKPDELIKSVAKVFREKEDVFASAVLHPKRKISEMGLRDLIEAFDPEESNSKIGERLLKLVKGERFIVFSIGRKINIEVTLKLLEEVKAGFNGRKSYEVDGEPKKVYKIGELPDNFADENPLYHNRPLRPDGTCDFTNVNWSRIPLNVRQVVYLAVKSDEIVVNAPNFGLFVQDLVAKLGNAPIRLEEDKDDFVAVSDGFYMVRSMFRNAALRFAELEKTNNLPSLKVELGSKSNRPFEGGHKVNQ